MKPLLKDVVLWCVYIINLDNRGSKSSFYGKKQIYYTGITTNLGRRFGDHLNLRGSDNAFIKKHWRNARKVPVYVEYYVGTEWEAMVREKQIKKLDGSKKLLLIASEQNMLVGYKPPTHIILKKHNDDGEVVIKVY